MGDQGHPGGVDDRADDQRLAGAVLVGERAGEGRNGAPDQVLDGEGQAEDRGLVVEKRHADVVEKQAHAGARAEADGPDQEAAGNQHPQGNAEREGLRHECGVPIGGRRRAGRRPHGRNIAANGRRAILPCVPAARRPGRRYALPASQSGRQPVVRPARLRPQRPDREAVVVGHGITASIAPDDCRDADWRAVPGRSPRLARARNVGQPGWRTEQRNLRAASIDRTVVSCRMSVRRERHIPDLPVRPARTVFPSAVHRGCG